MEIPSVLDEFAPYELVVFDNPHSPTRMRMTWGSVVRMVRRGHTTGVWPEPMAPGLQPLMRPHALVGLAVVLFFRQAALTADALVPLSWRDNESEWAL